MERVFLPPNVEAHASVCLPDDAKWQTSVTGHRADFLTIENSFLPSRLWPGFMPRVLIYRVLAFGLSKTVERANYIPCHFGVVHIGEEPQILL